jgi:hypothetical protein
VAVHYFLEIRHALEPADDGRELLVIDATVVEDDSVEEVSEGRVLAGVLKGVTVANTECVALEAESIIVQVVKDWQDKLLVLNALLEVDDALVILVLYFGYISVEISVNVYVVQLVLKPLFEVFQELFTLINIIVKLVRYDKIFVDHAFEVPGESHFQLFTFGLSKVA